MASLNKVFLMGNLTRDPELRYTPNGSAVASFGLAINRKYKQGDEWKEEACFVDITAWNKMAENCAGYLSKGRGVLVEGRLSYRTWETPEGQKRSKLDVVALNVQFLSKGSETNSDGSSEAGTITTAGTDTTSQSNNATVMSGVEEDVPF